MVWRGIVDSFVEPLTSYLGEYLAPFTENPGLDASQINVPHTALSANALFGTWSVSLNTSAGAHGMLVVLTQICCHSFDSAEAGRRPKSFGFMPLTRQNDNQPVAIFTFHYQPSSKSSLLRPKPPSESCC
jgi:hypothetical protein